MDTTDISYNNETTTEASDFNINDNDMQINNHNESMKFLFVPLAVVVTVMILSAMVYLMARRRRINTGYRRKVPTFSFDTSDRSEDEDYEVESQYLLGRLQSGKMHDSYQHCRANSELYD